MGSRVHSAVHDVVEELAVLRVLHDDEDAIGGFHDFVELGDGGVADQFEDVQFARDAFDVGDVLDLVLLEDLDRHRLARVPVDRLLHLPESALPDRLPESHARYSIR
jgi:hypothetical protein